MKELMIFENENFGSIRSLKIDNEPWFIAKDVCDLLGLSNSRKATSKLDEDEKNTVTLSDGIRKSE